MKLRKSNSHLTFPKNGLSIDDLSKITHLGIGAHQDDLEVMAGDGIVKCYKNKDQWFGGVTCTDGSGSARSGKFENYSDAQMADVRVKEQEKAASLGEFGFIAQLGYKSSEVKDLINKDLLDDMVEILTKSKPKIIYTHNLFDKHPTHVGVTLTLIEALRKLTGVYCPDKLYGCEVWRGLDWLSDKDKIPFDLTGQEHFIQKLINVFESQVAGGKRYDLATLGRIRSNATFFESHATDKYESLLFAVDMTDIVDERNIQVDDFVKRHLDSFVDSVTANLKS